MVGTTAAVVSSTIGSTVYVLPNGCSTVVRGGLTYYDCANVWYQPHYLGTGVTYVVVPAP